jgi:hypothetical protein
MTINDRELIKWIDYNVSIDITEPRLKNNAPEEIKKKFEEWQRQKADDEARGIWR